MSDNLIVPNSLNANAYGPVTPSQMFERTFALLRENFKLFFGIALVIIGVEFVVRGVIGGSGTWMGHSAAGATPVMRALVIVPLSFLGAVLIYIVAQIVHGALFLATRARLANAPMTVGEACGLAAEKAGRLIGISILVALRIIGYMLLLDIVTGLLVFVVALAFGGFSHVAEPLRSGHLLALGTGVFFVLFLLAILVAYLCIMFWLVLRYAVSIPACLEENLPITDAIRRSIFLSRGSKGRLVALFLVLACVWIAVAAVIVPIQLVARHPGAMHPTGLNVTAAAIEIFVSWVLAAFAGVATALCYYDLRVRKERYGAAPAVPVLETPPAPSLAATDWPIEDIPIS